MEADANIQLSPEDRARLEGWVAGRKTPQKLVWRARIVLMWAQGAGLTAIVRATGKTKRTAYRCEPASGRYERRAWRRTSASTEARFTNGRLSPPELRRFEGDPTVRGLGFSQRLRRLNRGFGGDLDPLR